MSIYWIVFLTIFLVLYTGLSFCLSHYPLSFCRRTLGDRRPGLHRHLMPVPLFFPRPSTCLALLAHVVFHILNWREMVMLGSKLAFQSLLPFDGNQRELIYPFPFRRVQKAHFLLLGTIMAPIAKTLLRGRLFKKKDAFVSDVFPKHRTRKWVSLSTPWQKLQKCCGFFGPN